MHVKESRRNPIEKKKLSKAKSRQTDFGPSTQTQNLNIMSHVCDVAVKTSTLRFYLSGKSGKYGETRNSCLLSVEK